MIRKLTRRQTLRAAAALGSFTIVGRARAVTPYKPSDSLLDAARKEGFKTCFVKRPLEWGPGGPPDPTPNPGCDLVVDGFEELATQLKC